MKQYLVIARKWRPQVFEELVGQEHVIRTIQNAIAADRLAHAFLFTGPRGVGKTSAARILAKAVNCLQGPTKTPCTQCENCREIADSNSIDVLEIDGASNTGVDNVRELRENVRYLPSKSRYKIYIIDEVHMLSGAAFNALLKTLEEPPPHVLFIFATTEPHKIPLTILSRCQRFDFKRIPLALLVDRLREITVAEGVQIDDDALMLICREAEGGMRDAQSLLDQVIAYSGTEIKRDDVLTVLGIADHAMLFNLSAAILQKDAKGSLALIDTLYNQGYDLEQFCNDFLTHFRNLLVAKLEGAPSSVLNVPEHEARDLADQAQSVSFSDLHRLFQILLKGGELMGRAPFPKIVFEMTVVEMARWDALLPVEEILARVEQLEAAFSHRGAQAEGTASGTGQPDKKDDKPVTPIPAPEVSEAQVAQGSTLGEEALNLWEKFLSFVRRENPILASFLIQGSLVRHDETCLEIGFAKDSFALERVNERQTLQSVEEIARRHFKQALRVKITATNAVKERKPSVAATGETDRSRHLKKEAVDNPVVQEAVEIFQGRIVEVKVKEGS